MFADDVNVTITISTIVELHVSLLVLSYYLKIGSSAFAGMNAIASVILTHVTAI